MWRRTQGAGNGKGWEDKRDRIPDTLRPLYVEENPGSSIPDTFKSIVHGGEPRELVALKVGRSGA